MTFITQYIEIGVLFLRCTMIMWHGHFGDFYYLLMSCMILFSCDVLRKMIYACFRLIEEVTSKSFV